MNQQITDRPVQNASRQESDKTTKFDLTLVMEASAIVKARMYTGALKKEYKKQAFETEMFRLSQDFKGAEVLAQTYANSNCRAEKWAKKRFAFHVQRIEAALKEASCSRMEPKAHISKLVRAERLTWDNSWKLNPHKER